MPKIRPGKQEEVEAPRPLRPAVVRVRGWAAGELLAWRWALPWLTAECSRAVYFIKAERREVLAHASSATLMAGGGWRSAALRLWRRRRLGASGMHRRCTGAKAPSAVR